MKSLANHKVAVRTREYLVQAIFQFFFNEQDISDIIDQFKDCLLYTSDAADE